MITETTIQIAIIVVAFAVVAWMFLKHRGYELFAAQTHTVYTGFIVPTRKDLFSILIDFAKQKLSNQTLSGDCLMSVDFIVDGKTIASKSVNASSDTGTECITPGSALIRNKKDLLTNLNNSAYPGSNFSILIRGKLQEVKVEGALGNDEYAGYVFNYRSS